MSATRARSCVAEASAGSGGRRFNPNVASSVADGHRAAVVPPPPAAPRLRATGGEPAGPARCWTGAGDAGVGEAPAPVGRGECLSPLAPVAPPDAGPAPPARASSNSALNESSAPGVLLGDGTGCRGRGGVVMFRCCGICLSSGDVAPRAGAGASEASGGDRDARDAASDPLALDLSSPCRMAGTKLLPAKGSSAGACVSFKRRPDADAGPTLEAGDDIAPARGCPLGGGMAPRPLSLAPPCPLPPPLPRACAVPPPRPRLPPETGDGPAPGPAGGSGESAGVGGGVPRGGRDERAARVAWDAMILG